MSEVTMLRSEADLGHRVPSGWVLKEMRSLGEVKTGLTYKPEDVDKHGTLVLRSSNIQDERLVFEDNVFVSKKVGDGATVRKGDILICVRNGSRRLIGKSALITAEADGMAFGAFMSAFRSDLSPYLIWVFQSEFVQRQIEENLGATINQITNATLKALKAPVPPPHEQQAIVAALSDADGVVAGLERVIAKKRLIKQGAMQDLLTARRRLPGFSGEWEITSLGSALRRSPSYGINAPAIPRGAGGFAYLRITDISDDGTVDPSGLPSVREGASDQYLLAEGDIVVARTGASVGKSHLFRDIGEPVVFAGFLIRLCPDETKLLPSFLSQFMQTQNYWGWVRENSARSGQPGVNGQQLRTILLTLPEIEEQQAIAAVLSDMDAEIRTLSTRLAKARAVKEGMMQNLLTGRVRLV